MEIQGDSVTASVKEGRLRGRVLKLSDNLGGKRYLSFQGIPYAQPPIGNLRFKDPVPVKPWTGIRDALIEGPNCIQRRTDKNNEISGEEDSLYLNVYVPENRTKVELLPVMVFIHGGGFSEGSGDSEIYGPDFIMRKGNVILVTINYRVGSLGFMYLGTDKISGNAGLKDQVLALRWVNENISQFNGDPNNITIFGESAGGASVHYLLLSPLAKGLFHRAIIQSGAALNPWAYIDKSEAKSRSIQLAKLLGCYSDDLDEISDFLLEVPAKQLIEKQDEILGSNNLFLLPFVPMIDGPSENVFLPNEPKEIMRKGNFNLVPLMIGGVSQEGQLLLMAFGGDKEIISKLDKDFSKIIPNNLKKQLDDQPEKKKTIVEKIRKFYLKDKPISMETLPSLIDVFSDRDFLFGVKEIVDNFVQIQSSYPIYLYLFDYDGKLGFLKNIIKAANAPIIPGPCHADELGYIFRQNKVSKEPEPNSTEFKVMETMVDMWTNFASTGNPSKNLSITWSPYNQNQQFLKIGSSLSIENDFIKERLDFWKKIYKEAESC